MSDTVTVFEAPPGLDVLIEDICGCGMGTYLSVVLDALSAAEEIKVGSWIHQSPGAEEEREFIAHYLGSRRVDLLEHGTGVAGSWLTDKGKGALVWLRGYLEAGGGDPIRNAEGVHIGP